MGGYQAIRGVVQQHESGRYGSGGFRREYGGRETEAFVRHAHPRGAVQGVPLRGRHSTYPLDLRHSQAQAGCDIPNIGTTHADYFSGDIPCTRDMTEPEVKGEYEKETGAVIIERFSELNPAHIPGVLVKNHGPFSWGKDPHEAVHNAVVMEQVAKMAFIAYQVNPNLTMNELLIQKHFFRKHGPGAYYGQK